MACSLCKVMGSEGGGERVKRERVRREENAVRSSADLSWMTGWYHSDSRYDRENAIWESGVCLISVHDGLSLFRRFSVIHPSLISLFKIVFARLHVYLHTQTLAPRTKKEGCRHPNVKISTRININLVMLQKTPRNTDAMKQVNTWQAPSQLCAT